MYPRAGSHFQNDGTCAIFPIVTNSISTDSGYDIHEILDHLPSLIGHWGRDQRNLFGNEAYRDWFGVDPGKLPGMHLREVIGEERYHLNLPFIEGVLRGEAQEFERTYPVPGDKRERHGLVHYVPDLRDGEVQGFFVLVTDITAVKMAGAALRETAERLRCSEERYRMVVDDQTEVISRFRGDGTFTFVNDVYCRFFGKSAEELVGSRWHPVAHADDRPHIELQLAALGPGNPVVVIENRVRSGRGQMHWMQFVNRGFFDADGRLLEIQSVGRDISDRRETEAALRHAHQELQRRVDQLRQLAMEATRAEERERRAIAHELHDDLGQLLHVAKLKLDALARRVPKAAVPLAGELDALLGDASRMVRSLTSQLRPPVLDDLGLVAALHWLAEEMERLHGIDVTTEVDCAVTAVAPEQSAIVFRTVRELLFNVAKHAGVAAARLAIRCSEGRLLVTVADSGVGMADIEATLVSRHGHGLASVRERIGFLGGSMAVSSAPGMGTSVTLTMPLQLAGEGA